MSAFSLKNKTIAVIGLGYVGLPLAVEFGKYRSVIGFDINKTRVEELKKGFDSSKELENDELKKATEILFTNNHNDIKNASIYIVTLPTPIDNTNNPNLEPLKNGTSIVGRYLKKGNVVIYESTVYPGVTEEICLPILEKMSGLVAIFNDELNESYDGFFLGYSPERINPGDKKHCLTNIIKVTSGSTPTIAREIDEMYKEIIKAGTYLAPSIKVAEAAKVIENTQRDLNIALVNELSIIFSKIGINTKDVLDAAGTKWNFLPFKPGLVGGHCIGIDPYYLTYKAKMLGYHSQVITAGRRINDLMPSFVAEKVIKKMIKNNIQLNKVKIGILGVTFKPNCSDIRNTKVAELVKELSDWGCHCFIHDPLANKKDVLEELQLTITDFISEKIVIDCLIIAVAHDTYLNDINNYLFSLHKKVKKQLIFIDLSNQVSLKKTTKPIVDILNF